MKKNILYISLSIIVLLLVGATYYFLFSTKNMNYSIILDKKKENGVISLTVYQNGKEKTIKVPENVKIEPAPCYNIKFKGNKVVNLEPVKYYSGKVLSIKGDEVNLPYGSLKLTDSTKYLKISKNNISKVSSKALVTGYQGYRFILNKDGTVKYVLCDIPKFNRIRTLISNSDFSTQNHSEITFKMTSEGEIKSKDINAKLNPNDTLTVEKSGDSMKFTQSSESGSKIDLGSTKNPVTLVQGDATQIAVPSLTRKSGYVPLYYGNFDMTLDKKGIHLVNETYIDYYLKGVIPSEMPPSGGVEGYSVQSIVSRTFAYYSMFSKDYAALGANILDSEASQIYNLNPPNPQSNEAVDKTSGEVIVKDGELVDAQFYSTSPGFGASYEDVFGKVSPSRDYLVASSFDESGEKVSVTSEGSITDYLKDWTVKAYDSNSPMFRWKYSIDYADISKIVNANIYDLYNKNPKNFKEQWHLFIYKKADIPKDGIGRIENISIGKRSSSGTVEELIIKTKEKTYKITGDDTLKKILVPKDGVELTTIYGKPIQGVTSLPSLFFTVEKNMTDGSFKSLTIYGGGEGVGVGLSKYGAIGLSRKGYDTKKILTTFYPGCEVVNLTKNFKLDVES